MPKSSRRLINPIPRQTRKLVHQAIAVTGTRRGATFKDIKKYVNANTNQPYVCDWAIKSSIRNSLNGGDIESEGVHYKIINVLPSIRTSTLVPKKSFVKPKTRIRSTTRGITSMHGWQKMLFFLIGFIVLSSLFVAVKAESDEDENILGEILFDLATGIAVDMCTQSAVCASMLSTFCVIFIITAAITWCCTGECMCDCNQKTARRAGTVYAGAEMSRWFRS
jgi:hypothetical protein